MEPIRNTQINFVLKVIPFLTPQTHRIYRSSVSAVAASAARLNIFNDVSPTEEGVDEFECNERVAHLLHNPYVSALPRPHRSSSSMSMTKRCKLPSCGRIDTAYMDCGSWRVIFQCMSRVVRGLSSQITEQGRLRSRIASVSRNSRSEYTCFLVSFFNVPLSSHLEY